MTWPVAAVAGVVAWLCLATPAAVVIGRSIGLADRKSSQPPTPQPPAGWSQTAVEAEFALMVPGWVTEESFDLDNQINRAAGWAEW